MSDLQNLTAVELQGLVDLARLFRGWSIAESVGMIDDGRPVPAILQAVEAEGDRRGITPRDPVVYPLDLLTSLLLNPDGGIPTGRRVDEMEFAIEAKRIIELESGNFHYTYRIGFPGFEQAGEIRITRGGLELRRGSEIWLIDPAKLFAAFVQKLGD